MPNLYVWKTTVFAALGALQIGYYDGSMSGILEMKGFQMTFNLYNNHTSEINDDDMDFGGVEQGGDRHDDGCSSGNGANADAIIGLVVSISNLGSAVGSLLAGWLSDHFSRKKGLLLGGAVMIVGAILLSTSFNIWMFILGRGICGIGVGLVYMIMPVYISELSPKGSRGMLTSIVGPSYALGTLTALFANVGFSRFPLGWRIATGSLALMGLLYFLGMLFIPHTPRWLVFKQREKEALAVLFKINHQPRHGTASSVDSCTELEELKTATSSSQNSSMWKFLEWKYISRLLIMVVLFFIFASTGNFIYFFSTTLFCHVQVKPFISVLVMGFITLLAAIVLTLVIDRVGRRSSLVGGAIVNMVLAGAVASLVLVFGTTVEAVSYAIAVMVCIYAFSTGCSWLTVPFVLASEVFPLRIRGFTVAVSTCSYWVFTCLVNQSTPLILGSPLELHGFFFIIAGINLFAVVFVTFTLPETKGTSLEEMEERFSQGCVRPSSCCARSGDFELQRQRPHVKPLDTQHLRATNPLVMVDPEVVLVGGDDGGGDGGETGAAAAQNPSTGPDCVEHN